MSKETVYQMNSRGRMHQASENLESSHFTLLEGVSSDCQDWLLLHHEAEEHLGCSVDSQLEKSRTEVRDLEPNSSS